jgi:hypothetical protein
MIPGQRSRRWVRIADKMKSYVCWMMGSSGFGSFGTRNSQIFEAFGH